MMMVKKTPSEHRTLRPFLRTRPGSLGPAFYFFFGGGGRGVCVCVWTGLEKMKRKLQKQARGGPRKGPARKSSKGQSYGRKRPKVDGQQGS